MFMAGCANMDLEPYRAPDSIASYAIIKDRPFKLTLSFHDKFIHILSIDRKRIDGKSRGIPKSVGSGHNDLKKALVLAVGVRKLHVEACREHATLFHVLFMPLGPHFRCADSILRLEASHGFQYRVRATVNKKDDYADFWIENIESGDKVTEPIRVNELYSK